MIVSEIKEALPDVKVKSDGQVYTGYVRGRLNRFATVWIPELDKSFEVAWETITFCVNNNVALSD
jgi:hypothetical protein